ncbi:MAG TPA: peptidoglycan-binding domain-containing protein [Hyphomicrobiaceae bacterium]|nr:peptidoglycan-binding domain-containing protein [Hyphomicrobiaceae bacterium]
MSKTTSFVVALGAFGALAYLLNPLPPDAPSAARVSTASQATAIAQPAVRESSAPAAARPPAQDATVRLVQQIQTELLRLGCYAGAVDGRWTPETQQAMHVLGERVRVLRPVETPDYIMLALARSQASHVCTASDRATAAARLPASRIVPSAAALEKAQPSPGATRVPRSADRRMAPDTSRVRMTRHDEDRRGARSDMRSAERAVPDPADDRAVLPRDEGALGENRMGLGAAQVDALGDGLAPRDPTAPAVLRGPEQAPPVIAELTPPPTLRRIERDERPVARPRNDWKRTIFSKLRESGP